MFSQFHCCSFTSETTDKASSKVVLDQTCRSEHIKVWSGAWWVSAPNGASACPPWRPGSAWLPASWRLLCQRGGVPSHSTGPPSPWTRNSYPPQSIMGALGLRLRGGEREKTGHSHIRQFIWSFLVMYKSLLLLLKRSVKCLERNEHIKNHLVLPASISTSDKAFRNKSKF